jgi:hypothetical protein
MFRYTLIDRNVFLYTVFQIQTRNRVYVYHILRGYRHRRGIAIIYNYKDF